MTMKTLRCRDIGGDDNHEVQGESDSEIKKKMWDHAAREHPDMVAAMTNEDRQKLNDRMDAILAAQ